MYHTHFKYHPAKVTRPSAYGYHTIKDKHYVKRKTLKEDSILTRVRHLKKPKVKKDYMKFDKRIPNRIP